MSGSLFPHRPGMPGSTAEDLIEMRFVLILLVAVALTLTWQTTVLAERPITGEQISFEHGSSNSFFSDFVADRSARQ